jgi:LuxR family maltose regulon positive regulatory protein
VPGREIRYKGVTFLFLGQAYFYAGNTNSAEQVISDAIQTNLASGHDAAYLGACHDLAQLRVLQGRLQEAKTIYVQAPLPVKARGTTIYAGTEHSGLGDLKREWNELEAASVEIQKGIELAETSDHIFFLVDVYLARVRLAMAQKDWEAAWSYLRKVEEVVHRCPTSTEIESIRTWQARVHLAQGNLAQAGQWAETKGMESTGSYGPQKEFELLTLARVWLAQGETDQAVSLLGRIRIAAENAGRHGRALEAQILQALVDQAAGNETQAVTLLSRVLAQAEPEGYARLFIDEGAPMQRLLAQWLDHAGTDPLRDYAIHLLSQFDPELNIIKAA